jgi:NAD(P)-dependent dehydrogenase (short-subunit alcohol dehydrogenase family)
MYSELFDLTGKVAVVTGATGVLCSAISHALATSGATVIPLAPNPKKVEALTSALCKNGAKPMGISADVLDKGAVEEAAKQILDRYEKVDILINGAGGNRPDATTARGQRTFFDIPPEALRWVVDLILQARFWHRRSSVRQWWSARKASF